MLYLREFYLPGEGGEATFLANDVENKRTCYGSRYPFGLFLSKGMPTVHFEPITIFCGGNGSGKTTLLNLIGESLGLQRSAPFNRSSFYNGYLKLCRIETTSAFKKEVQDASRVITSDDAPPIYIDKEKVYDNLY